MKKTLTFLLLICTLQSRAIWVQTGPEAGWFNIKEHNGILYSTTSIGLYTSINNGSNWNRVSELAGFAMNDLLFTNSKMLASTNKGIFYSIDSGQNWVSSNAGFTGSDTTVLGSLYIMKTNTGRLLTSLSSGTYYSDNNGSNWSITTGAVPFVYASQNGNDILGLGSNNLYRSVDNGQTWNIGSSNGINSSDLNSLDQIYFYNGKVYLICNTLSVYESIDNGLNWSLITNGLTGNNIANSTCFLNNKIYKLTSNGIFELNFLTNVWSLSNISQANDVRLLGYNNNRYFEFRSRTYDAIIYSDDNGSTWQDCNGIKCMIVQKLSVSDQMYALWNVGGFIYDSTQTAFERYSPYNQNFSANTYVQYGVLDIKKRSNGTIYLGTPGGVWKSTNNGASYTQSYNGLPALGVTQTRNVYDMFIAGSFPNDTLYAATDDGIYYSIDEAQTFMLCAGTSGAKMQQFLKYDGVLYCAGTKIYMLNTGNNWAQFAIINTTGILGFAATDGYFFVATANNTLKYSPISGSASFTPITSGSPGFAYSVAAYDTLVFYCSQGGVYKLNTTLLGSATPTDLVQVADNLPYYLLPTFPSQQKAYSYLDRSFSMAVFNGKLWLGTNGMSTFYRSLNDFGYSITVKDKEKKTQQQSLVFPNPAKDKITFTALEKGCQINIFNCSGQVVLTKTFVESPTIDIAKLSIGIYTYSIIDSKEMMIDHGKFVKE
jgi:hypothetical protein